MLRINARALENMLLAVEEIVENVEGEFPTQLQKLKTQSRGIPKTIFQEFIKVTKILVTPSSAKLGQLVVLTGVDKSGKETQAFNPENRAGILSIYDYFVSKSFRVFRLALPSYQTPLGSLIWSYLGKGDPTIKIVGDISKDVAWVLWSIDRAQHNPQVEKWLKSNAMNVVLSKRWTETNIAYQKPLGIGEKRILNFERNVAKADYTIVLDVPLKLIFRRMEVSGESPDKYETPELLTKVTDIYKNLEKFYPYGKILHIDGSGLFEEVNERLLKRLSDIKPSRSVQIVSEKSY